MIKKLMKKILPLILAVGLLVAGVTAVFGANEEDIPVAYVITDGSEYYYIDFEMLFESYFEYMFDKNAPEAKLAKFYFDTLGDQPMERMVAYVSGVTGKFVSYEALFDKYFDTMLDVGATYRWFNSTSSTPMRKEITKTLTLNAAAVPDGRYYVNTLGYIIPRSVYTMSANTPATAQVGRSTEFTLNISSDGYGSESFSGVLVCEGSGGTYKLEKKVGSAWQVIADGTIESATILPEWNRAYTLRFTPQGEGTHNLTFKLKEGSKVITSLQKTISVQKVASVALDMASTARTNEPFEISLNIAANSDEGKKAKAVFSLPTGTTLEYYNGSTWTTVSGGVYEPTGGFNLQSGEMRFRAVFADTASGAGKNISVNLVEVASGQVLATAAKAITIEKPMVIVSDVPETFYTGEPGEVTFGITANSDVGKGIVADLELPSGISAEYFNGTDFVPVSGEVELGALMATDEYKFRFTANTAGVHSASVVFKDKNTGAVLGKAEIDIKSEDKERIPMEIDAKTSEFYTGEPSEVVFTIAANDDAGKEIVARLELSGGVSAEFFDGTDFVPVSDDIDLGTLADGDQFNFRFTADAAGDEHIIVLIIEDDAGNELGRKELDITVVDRVVNNIYFPGFKELTYTLLDGTFSPVLGNPAKNQADMKISLLLGDDVLYASDVLEPGDTIENVILELSDAPLASGSYEITLRYEAFAHGTEDRQNSSDVKLTLIVK